MPYCTVLLTWTWKLIHGYYQFAARSYTYGRQGGDDDLGFGYYGGQSGGGRDDNNDVEDDGAYGKFFVFTLPLWWLTEV